MDVSSLFSAATTPTSTLDVGTLLQSNEQQNANLAGLLDNAKFQRDNQQAQLISDSADNPDLVQMLKDALAVFGTPAGGK